MIVGKGAIASALKGRDRDDRIYFASGVPNSREWRQEEYAREASLLLSQPRHKRLVYFSSLCVFTVKSQYADHKKRMEELVQSTFPQWTVMRLGNAAWATNPCQLIPFIKEKLRSGSRFCLWDEYRHLLQQDEFLYWIDQIPDWNCEMNVTGERLKVSEIMARYQNSWLNCA